ncbi:hypothetical protein I6G51_03045 [Corynebacterium minutissimum]|uniref:Uncharacterized protein n=1 Tax=Corynebacterium minutissimum TaxID=38301 RepID=A0A2X4US92_9CORY|nr:hypothetical protein [Corynebacterium minutissimum]KHO30223.1 hypothetical protein NX84_02410 [Corynebacterium minutissimum]QPS60196.1 hypothetical protein I6G51_03045 [Corynebacterium minutissimum]QQA79014.1 hypothetical protein I6H49_09805 [Corynebacterium minutissimum]SQI00974.1 Uncharacterised protein [Corynebacterium minutissimum]VEG04958.1 Uncharacterised protein [Corynebacterium minutissimum]
MRARFRAPGLKWRTGDLTINEVRDDKRHRCMSFIIASHDGKSVAFEIKDKDIYRLADSIVDHVEAFELGKKAQQ